MVFSKCLFLSTVWPSYIYIYIYIYIYNKEKWIKLTILSYTLPIIYIYIYIYIYYIVLFGPVKPELGVIPSGQKNIQK